MDYNLRKANQLSSGYFHDLLKSERGFKTNISKIKKMRISDCMNKWKFI